MAIKGIETLIPIKNYVSLFSTFLNIFLNLSPIVIFINIVKGKEEYTNIPPMVLIFSFLNNAIWGGYWYRKNELSVFWCCFICVIIATIFSAWYLFYFAQKNIGKFLFHVLCQIACEIGIIIIFFSHLIDLTYVGILLIVINTMQYVAPAQNLIKVIKEKNHKLIPIVTTIIGAACSGGWLLFGLIVGDINSIISNGLGCLSSIITTFIWFYIYIKYGKKEGKEEDEKELVEKPEDEEK